MTSRPVTRSAASHLVALLCLLGLGTAVAQETEARRYPLGREGVLMLKVPVEWREAIERPDPDELPTITYGVRSGVRFVVTLRNFLLATPPDAAALRSRVEDNLDSVRPQAVEVDIPLREVKGRAGGGWYFSATDITPSKGGFRFLARGVVQVRELTIDFMVLTNEGTEHALPDAIAMLESALFVRRRGEEAPAAAP